MENQFDKDAQMDAQTKNLTLISQSFIINQIALDWNERIKHTKFYKHDLKKWLKMVQGVLFKAEEKEYDIIFETAEKETCQTYQVMQESIEEIASLGLHHLQNIAEIVKAYKKDPKSINGIVTKINRG